MYINLLKCYFGKFARQNSVFEKVLLYDIIKNMHVHKHTLVYSVFYLNILKIIIVTFTLEFSALIVVITT